MVSRLVRGQETASSILATPIFFDNSIDRTMEGEDCKIPLHDALVV